MSLGISKMAAGAAEEANSSSGGTSARAPTLNEAIVSGNFATSRSSAIGSLNQEPTLAPKGVPAGFNALSKAVRLPNPQEACEHPILLVMRLLPARMKR